MKTTQRKLSRRNFLLSVGAGTAAGAAAIVARKDKETDSASSQHGAESKGYQLTEHVRNYYRTAKI